MPIYEFECRKCGEIFEALRPMDDTGRTLTCPECGAKAPKKIFSTFATGGCSSPGSTSFG
jgi:putative FmdB family regulatory protein